MGVPITGRQRPFGFKKGADWGTAVAMAAGDGMPLTDDSLSPSRTVEKLRDESAGIGPFVQTVHRGLENLSGSLAGTMRFEGAFELMLGMVMGSPGVKVGANPTVNTIKLQDTNNGIFGTYATERTSDSIVEIPSVKVNGLTLSANMGELVAVDFKCIGNIGLITGEPGIVNTPETLALLTMDTDVLENMLVFDRNSEFLINNQTGDGALTPGTIDEMNISAFNFEFDRGGDQVHASGVNGIVESKEDAFPNPKFNFTMYEYTNDNAITTTTSADLEAAFGRENQKMKARFRILRNAFFSLDLYLPSLSVVVCNPPTTELGRTITEVECECLRASANPTGMDDVGPFYFVMTNTNADVLWA